MEHCLVRGPYLCRHGTPCLAIRAVHASLVDGGQGGDLGGHMLYFANSGVLDVDSGILDDTCYLDQVQVFGIFLSVAEK